MNILMLADEYRTLKDWSAEWLHMNAMRVDNHKVVSMTTTLKSGDTLRWVSACNFDRIRGEVYDLVFTNDRCRTSGACQEFEEACRIAHQRIR